MGVVWLLLASAVVLLTAFSLAGCLRLRRAVDFILAVYVLAFAEVVTVCLLLSPGHWLSSGNLWTVLLVVGALTVLTRRLVPGWSVPSFRPLLASLHDALADPLLTILAVALLGAFGYVVALIVGTAPNDYDVLWYHLARAAFWKQQHAVAYIPNANDARLNGFPPNAEIADTFTMIFSRSEHFAGFVQLSSLLAGTVAIGGIGRRIGLSVRQAAFGALLFATLPVVILQSSTSLNDLVFSVFLVIAAYFLFTWSRVTLALTALALGLAIGTKITALLGLAVLALLGAFLYPRRRWPALVGVGLAGILLGAPWYILNLVKTHHLDGKLANPENAAKVTQGNTFSPAGVVAHFMRLVIDAVDPSGAVGRDRFLYLVAAGVVLVLAVRARKRLGHTGIAAAVGLAALPLAFRAIDHAFLHGYQKLWVSAGKHTLAFLGSDKHLTAASPFQSWYGPAGILLVLAGFWFVGAGLRRRALPRVTLLLALAPVIWLVLQAVTTFYSMWDGRYTMFAVALGAAVWGLVQPIRPLAWAATAIAVTAMALALVHYDEKPSGVNVLGGSAPTSVWDRSRAQQLARWLHPGEEKVVAYLEKHAKKGQTIWLEIRRKDVSYPYFGADLDRHVTFLPNPTPWMVAAPGRPSPDACCQTLVVNSHGWRLYRFR